MNNPPAFPGKQKALLIKSEHSDIAKEYEIDQNGMTLRDYFAAKAMKEIMVQAYELEQECFTDGDFSFPDTMCSITKEAYKWADAMLKAREA